MPCYHPISAWQLLDVLSKNGKPTISFKDPFAVPSATRVSIQVPCGQCIGCRLENSRQWAMRCVHEAHEYDDNIFITLTYDNKHLPVDGSLDKSHFQKFMKRLRKYASCSRKFKKSCRKKFGKDFLKIRFFHCGEYGEKNFRPHYHACLFNFDLPDKVLYTVRDGCRLYMSPILEKIWGMGFVTVGDVTFESAAYVARYIAKKITGVAAEGHYRGKLPEYTTMSRGGAGVDGLGGIGKVWYDKYRSDVFPADNVVVRGKVMKPPRYYDKKYEVDNPEVFRIIKSDRKTKALLNADDNTKARLKVKEQCKLKQYELLKRGMENDT